MQLFNAVENAIDDIPITEQNFSTAPDQILAENENSVASSIEPTPANPSLSCESSTPKTRLDDREKPSGDAVFSLETDTGSPASLDDAEQEDSFFFEPETQDGDIEDRSSEAVAISNSVDFDLEDFDSLDYPFTPPDTLNEDIANVSTLEQVSSDSAPISNSLAGETKTKGYGRLFKILCASAASASLVAALAIQWLLSTPHWNTQALLPIKSVVTPLCEFLYCFQDLDNEKYRSTELIVASHPEEQGALVLRTTLLNTANRPLPYPDLSLEFSDMKDNMIASRVFSASEYLGEGFLKQKKLSGSGTELMLAQKTPVTIELEFVDPGRAAVNYNIRYLHPNNL